MMFEDIIATCYAITPALSAPSIIESRLRAGQASAPASDEEDEGRPESEGGDEQLCLSRFPVASERISFNCLFCDYD